MMINTKELEKGIEVCEAKIKKIGQLYLASDDEPEDVQNNLLRLIAATANLKRSIEDEIRLI